MNKHLKKFLNLSLLGVGLGVLVGSFLQIFANINLTKQINDANTYSRSEIKRFGQKINFKLDLSNYNKEIENLSSKWQYLASLNGDLEVGAYLITIDSKEYAAYESEKVLPAASTIKIPILLLILEMLDHGELDWDEEIKLKEELIGGGSGWMAYEKPGTLFAIHEIANEMIRISDNTATNLLINRIGGIKIINERLKEIGLEDTKLNNLLPDLEGTNTTTPKDLTLAIEIVESGKILSNRSRDLFREIMGTSVSNNLLPAGILKGLGKSQENIDKTLLINGYRVYNKTGDIGISYGDAGIIQMPTNKRAIASIIVKGPFNDPRSPELIREMAAAIIQEGLSKKLLNPRNKISKSRS